MRSMWMQSTNQWDASDIFPYRRLYTSLIKFNYSKRFNIKSFPNRGLKFGFTISNISIIFYKFQRNDSDMPLLHLYFLQIILSLYLLHLVFPQNEVPCFSHNFTDTH